MDAVFYRLYALRIYRDKSLQEVQATTFEISMLGMYRLDIDNPKEKHVLQSLPGRAFSAL